MGGVAILTRRTISVRNVRCKRDSIHSDTVESKFDNKWVDLTSVYVPHELSNPDTISHDLLDGDKQKLIGGDMNARHTTFGDETDN